MSHGFEIIRARVKDDAVILIDRLMRSVHGEIVLVLPKNSIIAADLNSLKTLKEEAESVGKILSLNTANDKIKSFAKTLGILTYDADNYKKIEKADVVKPTKKIKIMTDILPPASIKTLPDDTTDEVPELQQYLPEPVIYETANKNSDLEKNLESFYADNISYKTDKLEQKNKSGVFTLNRIIIFFTASGLILFGFTMYLILPKASIKISLREIPLKAQIPVAVSKNASSINLTNGIIPGQYFLLNKTGSVTLKGSSVIGGTIEIYNAYSAFPQKLVAKTRFETKDGKVFKIESPVVIPGAKISGSKLIPSFVKINVVADKNSGDYLIGPSYFTIPGFKNSPKYAGFYAKSGESMSKIETISVSKEELEKNKNELKDKLAKDLETDTLNSFHDSGLRAIIGSSSVKISEFKIVNNVLNMKVTWQAVLFKEEDLRTLINYFVSSHYPDLKSFSFEDTITYPTVNRADFDKGELFFTFSINKNNALPADVNNLKKELAGQDENNMRAIISDKAFINNAAISLWPFWVKKAPNNPEKINITIDNK